VHFSFKICHLVAAISTTFMRNIGRAKLIVCPTNPTRVQLAGQMSYLSITFQRPYTTQNRSSPSLLNAISFYRRHSGPAVQYGNDSADTIVAEKGQYQHQQLHPHNELKLKQLAVSKQFRNSFETVLFQFHFVVRTVQDHQDVMSVASSS